MIMIEDPINDATQYVTLWFGEPDERVALATAQRRRIYEHGPAWRLYDTDGRLIGRVWSTPRHDDGSFDYGRLEDIVIRRVAAKLLDE